MFICLISPLLFSDRSLLTGKNAGHGGDGLLAIRARGPDEDGFYEILSKFKLAFNLLAKLKGILSAVVFLGYLLILLIRVI